MGSCCGNCGCGRHCSTHACATHSATHDAAHICAAHISGREREFLTLLAQTPFLPLARFVMCSTRSEHLQSVALAPVWLEDGPETMECVHENRELLLGLTEKGFITLDYDLPLQGCKYEVFYNSAAYRAFRAAVEEGGKNDGFLFDRAELELGSLALTARGQQAIEALEMA